MVDNQKIAEQLLTELNAEIANHKEQAKLMEGAMHGVRLLFQRLSEAQETDEQGQDNEPVGTPAAE